MWKASALFTLLASGSKSQAVDLQPDEALARDDECREGTGACGLSALQTRKVKTAVSTDSDELSRFYEEALVYAEAAEGKYGDSFREFREAAKANASTVWVNLPMPKMVQDYEGVAWPPASFHKENNIHIFAIGDWGGLQKMDKVTGKNSLSKTAPNARHHMKCPENCNYVSGVDDKAQLLVADQVKHRSTMPGNYPEYFLNVGDNFYWAGVHQRCGNIEPNDKTMEEFQVGWIDVYGDLTRVPWLSVLGNHDYGGFVFTNGWDAQLGYTWLNPHWIMPARYFSRIHHHPGFSIEYLMIDSNTFDAHTPGFDIMHNICSTHNSGGATCASSGGPSSAYDCEGWFRKSYNRQKQWVQDKLLASKADWQIIVTHFPCGHESAWYKSLHENFGLDLLVTGHRHDQELWPANMKHGADGRGLLGGLTCFVTGGGGGVTSEESPGNSDMTDQYGFFDLTVSKTSIHIELINLFGKVLARTTAFPVGLPTTTTTSTTLSNETSTTPDRGEDQSE